MGARHDTTETLGLWLVAEVAARWSLSRPIARQVVAHVLGAVERDLERAGPAFGHSDLDVAARSLAVRMGYARDRIGGTKRPPEVL